MRIAVYLRISRDRTGAGVGVDRQERDCRDMIARSDWQPASITTYSDNDLSAYSGKRRPGYRHLLADIEAGLIDRVVAWHTDRLHRAPIELEEWIGVTEPKGVEVHTVKTGPIDLATPSGRMVARQLGAVARYESEHRSERVTTAMRDIAAAGGFRGGARPFGYCSNGITVRPDEARLIKSGTQAILDGKSLRSVVISWNRAGAATTVAGHAWIPKTTRGVLTRARNAGLIEHNGQVIGPAAWPAIVSESEWRGVVAILTDPKRRTNRGFNKAKWLGSNLYVCGVCGDRLIASTAGSRSGKSYRCKSSSGGQRHVARNAPLLDEFVEQVLVTRLSMPDAIDLFAPAEPQIDTDAITTQLTQIESERKELGERLGRGDITMSMFDAAASGYASRERELQAQLAADVTTNPLREILTAEDVTAYWAGLDLPTKRDVLDALLTVTVLPAPRGRQRGGGYFDPDSVRIEPK